MADADERAAFDRELVGELAAVAPMRGPASTGTSELMAAMAMQGRG